ncbi:MAG TPA: hypothetical protein DCG78_04310 [Anaerolineaceae bacterium]|nr:hypothetical protein [Anaerolineaceae bacterium]
MEIQSQNKLSDLWWIVLLEGIATVILGLLLITQPVSTTGVILMFIGVYWLIEGILSIVRIFTKPGKAPWFWSLIIGILGIVAGIVVLGQPLLSATIISATLTTIIAIIGIAMGIMEIARGVQGDGIGAVIFGILSILIGIWLLLNPLAGAIVLPSILGIFGLIGGGFLIYFAIRVHSEIKKAES